MPNLNRLVLVVKSWCLVLACLLRANGGPHPPMRSIMPIHYRNIPSPLLFLFAVCCIMPCVAQRRPAAVTATSSTSGSDGHTWHLRREERSAPLTDWQTHQTRTFKMMSMLLPVGWQLDVRPGPNFATIDCADTSGRIMISATSTDKGTGIFVIPANASMSSNSPAFLQQKEGIMRNFKGVFNCTIDSRRRSRWHCLRARKRSYPGRTSSARWNLSPGSARRFHRSLPPPTSTATRTLPPKPDDCV